MNDDENDDMIMALMMTIYSRTQNKGREGERERERSSTAMNKRRMCSWCFGVFRISVIL